MLALVLGLTGCLGVQTGVTPVTPADDTSVAVPVCASGSALLGSIDAVYCLDLDTLAADRIPIQAANSWGIIGGLALDRDGTLFGACFGDLYRIDLSSGDVVNVGETVPGCALASLPDGSLLGIGGAALDGLYVIDPETGSAVEVATSGEFKAGGDMVLHPDGFAYWTVVERQDESRTHLLRVNPETWEWSDIGLLDRSWVLSLMYVDDRLLGVTEDEGAVIEIDPTTAATGEIYSLNDWVFDATAAPWW